MKQEAVVNCVIEYIVFIHYAVIWLTKNFTIIIMQFYKNICSDDKIQNDGIMFLLLRI